MKGRMLKKLAVMFACMAMLCASVTTAFASYGVMPCYDVVSYADACVEVSGYTSYCDVDASLTAYNLRSGEYVDWGSDSDSDDMLAEVSFSTTGEYVGYSISTSHYASITNDYDSDYCSDGFYVTNE